MYLVGYQHTAIWWMVHTTSNLYVTFNWSACDGCIGRNKQQNYKIWLRIINSVNFFCSEDHSYNRRATKVLLQFCNFRFPCQKRESSPARPVSLTLKFYLILQLCWTQRLGILPNPKQYLCLVDRLANSNRAELQWDSSDNPVQEQNYLVSSAPLPSQLRPHDVSRRKTQLSAIFYL